jgi:tRNA threonylcarbamoyladenosine biosynthesis protein TsaE
VVARAERAAIDLISHSSLHTERLGERLGERLRAGDVVAVWGDLGSGKTVLAKGIARGLGSSDPVTSPTFLLAHEYGGRIPMFHLDFYRLRPDQVDAMGWDEYLDLGGVVVVEWPDRAAAALPPDRLDIRLDEIADTKRRIVLEAHGPRARELLDGVADAFGP